MARKLFSINTTASRDGIVFPGWDVPTYAEYIYANTTVIWGDGTERVVQKEFIDPDFDHNNLLNNNIIHLGIDTENEREYFSCRSEIDITNFGGANASTLPLEWQEESFPLTEETTLRIISRIDDNGNQVPDMYEMLVETYSPHEAEFYGISGNTGIQRVDELGFTVPTEWKDNLIEIWDSNVVNIESANTESANTGA